MRCSLIRHLKVAKLYWRCRVDDCGIRNYLKIRYVFDGEKKIILNKRPLRKRGFFLVQRKHGRSIRLASENGNLRHDRAGGDTFVTIFLAHSATYERVFPAECSRSISVIEQDVSQNDRQTSGGDRHRSARFFRARHFAPTRRLRPFPSKTDSACIDRFGRWQKGPPRPFVVSVGGAHLSSRPSVRNEHTTAHIKQHNVVVSHPPVVLAFIRRPSLRRKWRRHRRAKRRRRPRRHNGTAITIYHIIITVPAAERRFTSAARRRRRHPSAATIRLDFARGNGWRSARAAAVPEFPLGGAGRRRRLSMRQTITRLTPLTRHLHNKLTAAATASFT